MHGRMPPQNVVSSRIVSTAGLSTLAASCSKSITAVLVAIGIAGLAHAPHPVHAPGRVLEVLVVEVLDAVREARRVVQRVRRVRVVAQAVLGEGLGQRAVAGQLVVRRVDAALELVRREAVRALELARVLDQLLGRAHLGHAVVGVAEEQVAGERHVVAQPAAEQVVDRHAEALADQVQARELDRRVDLDPVVVERRGRVADLRPQLLERGTGRARAGAGRAPRRPPRRCCRRRPSRRGRSARRRSRPRRSSARSGPSARRWRAAAAPRAGR